MSVRPFLPSRHPAADAPAARHLGRAPREAVIFGVQPRDVFRLESTGLELSEEVAETVPKVIDLALIEVQKR